MLISAGSLLVGLPTHDGRAMVHSLTALSRVGSALGRPVQFLIGEAGSIPRSRNLVLDMARRRPEVDDVTWILWLDSDILIPADAVDAMVHAILWSESTDKSWVAHYRMADGTSVLMREKSAHARHYTADEIQQLDNFAEVGLAGLGLAYIKTDVRYIFHSDELGEDVHFFLDQPHLTIHLAKDIRVLHRKAVLI
ncbi:MAG: hypothetical protein C7B45_15610 [Sulfobacillus acidophilus]|uniref:Glycosyl transferase n=1 Tax=Sulfobacillus acidophilus TaxID=53633 RepID=A0A2T2WDI7_9FIRM|nr:MAG: hypothetical protein C7B45_15610 [Sulfobacillus acidophilus]